jgi:hypothetical protein
MAGIGLLGLAGCATVSRDVVGTVPPAAAVAAVGEGASIGEVLEHLGAPLEYWSSPDGLLLIWRERRYDFERLQLDPSFGLRFVSLDPTIGSALANLRLVLQRGKLREQRLAVLFDRAGRVIAVAERDGDGKRLR